MLGKHPVVVGRPGHPIFVSGGQGSCTSIVCGDCLPVNAVCRILQPEWSFVNAGGTLLVAPDLPFRSMLVRPPLTLLTFFPVSVGLSTMSSRSFGTAVFSTTIAILICSLWNGRKVPRSVVHPYNDFGPLQISGIDSAIRKVPFDDTVNRRDAKTPNLSIIRLDIIVGIIVRLPEFAEHIATCERYRGVRSGVIQPGRTVLTCYARRSSHESGCGDTGNRRTLHVIAGDERACRLMTYHYAVRLR